ncbi:unnamed protein product, partial [Didymodactylos carnosus]
MRCGRRWQSTHAWANFGQECEHCTSQVKPHNLQKLYVYICNWCDRRWSDRYSSNGLKCHNCGGSDRVLPLNYDDNREYIHAHRLRHLNDGDWENYIDRSKPHREDLCEKCRMLQAPCWVSRHRIRQNNLTDRRSIAVPWPPAPNTSFVQDDSSRSAPEHDQNV